MNFRITTILISIIITSSCEQQLNFRLGNDIKSTDDKILSGDYIGQELPNSQPTLFASGIVSNGLNNRDIAITPDGNEVYFTSSTPNYSYATIFKVSRQENNWQDPEVVSFGSNPDFISIEPCLSYDGNTLFYVSNRPVSDTAEKDDMNIWKIERIDDDWGKPTPLNSNINTNQGEYYPSLTKTGRLYFTREEANRINFIYRSDIVDGIYTIPKKLPLQINCGRNRFNAYVDPDESFIIIPAIGVEETLPGTNYYISFNDGNDNWSNPQNMGSIVNEGGRGWSASLSPDGKYLFFMSSRALAESLKPDKLSTDFFNQLQDEPQNGNSDIYWVNADFIKDHRNKAIFEN